MFLDLCRLAKVVLVFKKDYFLSAVIICLFFFYIFSQKLFKNKYIRELILSRKNINCYNQSFCFSSNHYTRDALASLMESIELKVDTWKFICSILFDKVLDLADNKIPLYKLEYMCFEVI